MQINVNDRLFAWSSFPIKQIYLNLRSVDYLILHDVSRIKQVNK